MSLFCPSGSLQTHGALQAKHLYTHIKLTEDKISITWPNHDTPGTYWKDPRSTAYHRRVHHCSGWLRYEPTRSLTTEDWVKNFVCVCKYSAKKKNWSYIICRKINDTGDNHIKRIILILKSIFFLFLTPICYMVTHDYICIYKMKVESNYLREKGITERGEMGRLVRGEEGICLRYYNCMKTFNVN